MQESFLGLLWDPYRACVSVCECAYHLCVIMCACSTDRIYRTTCFLFFLTHRSIQSQKGEIDLVITDQEGVVQTIVEVKTAKVNLPTSLGSNQ
jgi:hypothetical protein